MAAVSKLSAVSFTMVSVGDANNPANPATGLGSVVYDFRISAYETTNSQYVEFLNNSSVGATNQYSVYSSQMGSNGLGGITQSGSNGTYTYAVKSGFGDRPVNFVSWFSAARFVNWYANGANLTASTEVGTYTLNGRTTGSVVARNADSAYFLPSANEWTKAAFYNANDQSYYLWPTGSNSTPTGSTAAGDKGNANTAAFGVANAQAVSVGLQNVGSYTNTTSPYGLYDMLGNVSEVTDTSSIAAYSPNQPAVGNGSTALRLGGGLVTGNGVALPITNFNSDYNLTDSGVNNDFVLGNAVSGTLGFRIAAIPEPSTWILMAVAGTLLAVKRFSRRRAPAA